MDTKINSGSIRLSSGPTSARQTAKTSFGAVLREGFYRTVNVVGQGAQVAAPFIPGGAIVSAAIAGSHSVESAVTGGVTSGLGSRQSGLAAGPAAPASVGGSGASSYGSGGVMTMPGVSPGVTAGSAAGASAGGMSDSMNQMMAATKQMAEMNMSFNMQYLGLQEKIQQDTRQFSMVSNVMKTKHDAAKNSINNVR